MNIEIAVLEEDDIERVEVESFSYTEGIALRVWEADEADGEVEAVAIFLSVTGTLRLKKFLDDLCRGSNP